MQHSVRELRAIGIQPDILLCRTDRFLSPDIKAKLALYCDVPEEAVITAKDVDSIYEVPLVLSGEGLDAHRPEVAGPATARGARHGARGRRSSTRIKNPRARSSIGIVGKYVSFEDSYKSLNEALTPRRLRQRRARRARAGWRRRSWRAATPTRKLAGVDGILVPGGFGARGTGGMVAAAEYARRTGTPYFGICYGFQWAVTEYARNVCGLRRRELDRGGPGRRAQGHLQAAGPAGRRRHGRHHAPRLLHRASCSPGSRAARDLRRDARSASATATATSSTRTTRAA